MSPFNSESFPDSLAIATENTLTIGTIDDIQKLHIRTVPLAEMPRRIAHQEETRTFLVITTKVTIDPSGDELHEYYARLFDDQTFEILNSFKLDANEQGWSVATMHFADDPQVYYVVGTTFALPNEPEPTSGRLLVFTASEGKLSLVVEKEAKGVVYNVLPFNGKLLVSVNSKIQLFRWIANDVATGSSCSLKEECSKTGHILALYVVTRGDFIIVGDLMKSVSLYAYRPVDGTIIELAKDYSPNWMTGIEALDDDTFLGAENSMNLFVLHKNSDAASDEERSRLETKGEFHVGEFINRFRHGSLVMRQPDTELGQIPTVIFGTVNGVIGVIASLPQETYDFLASIQKNLTKVIKGVGGFTHDHWRSFHTERKTIEARNFIDGDLIEMFLDLKQDKMQEVVKGLDISVEETCKRIEALVQAIH